MTRKDYIAISTAIAGCRLIVAYEREQEQNSRTLERVAVAIADVMAADNSSFDRARFLSACGIQQEGQS